MNGSLGGIALLNALKWNRVALMVCVGITVGCSEALPIAGGALEGKVRRFLVLGACRAGRDYPARDQWS